jgi:hypothetical protein
MSGAHSFFLLGKKSSLSAVPLTHSQLQSEKPEWKIPEMNNLCFKLCTALNSIMKSHAVLFCWAWCLNCLFVQCDICYLSVSHLIDISVIRLTVVVSQCLYIGFSSI